jgi:hypothetical protein
MSQPDSPHREEQWLGADELRRLADPDADPLQAAPRDPEPPRRTQAALAGTVILLLALLAVAMLVL